MIHPRMATMLAVVLTDATVDPAVLHGLLRPAAARTWDQLSVDGDTSTNDTVFVLASGAAGTAPVTAGGDAAASLGAAIEAVARDLARQQAADGEGATTLLTCQVSGRSRRRRRPGGRARSRLEQPGQGGGPRARPELGPDRRGGRQRPAGRRRDPRGGGRRRRADAARRAGRPADARARSAADRDRRPPRVRRPRRRPVAFDRAAARAAMDAPELAHPARPRARRRRRRGVRLRPDRGVRDRERGVHDVRRGGRERDSRRQARAGRRSPSSARSSRRSPRSRASGRSCSSTAAASGSPSGSTGWASRRRSRAASG